VAVLALLGIAGKRGRPWTGAVLAAAYLNFPRVPLLMELAWYEPMLAAVFGTGLLLVLQGRRLGYFLLGLGVTGKPYGVFLLPPLAKALWSRRWALLAGVVLAGVLVVLPFFLWDPAPFLDRVIFWHLRNPLREDGITLQAAAFNELGITVPTSLLFAAAVLPVGLVTWRTPGGAGAPPGPMGTALLIFCLFHSQAFFNYFYLCQYLLLLGLVDGPDLPSVGEAKPQAPGVTRRRRAAAP
jgi:hypothetical protein